jgi:hypothetical protein
VGTSTLARVGKSDVVLADVEDDIRYVDRRGVTISRDVHQLLMSDYKYKVVAETEVADSVRVYTRFDGLVGHRTWYDGKVTVYKPFITFLIHADDTGSILGDHDTLEEAKAAHLMFAESERKFQLLVADTAPAVRGGVL